MVPAGSVRALWHFDLGAADLPPGATVTSVHIQASSAGFHGDPLGIGESIVAQRVLASWTDDITWTDRDLSSSWLTPGGDLDATEIPSDSSGFSLRFDVTGDVIDMLDNEIDNDGFALSAPANPYDQYYAEGVGSNVEPYLEIEYDTP